MSDTTPLDAQVAALLTTIANVRVSNAAGVAAVALLMYDALLCLPMEVEYIWLAKPSLPKLLYLFSRYYGLAHVVINISIVTRLNLSEKFCVGYNWWTSVGGAMCFTTAVNVILLMRVYALHNQSKPVLVTLGVLVLAEFAIECYVSIEATLTGVPTVFTPPPGLPLPGCWFNPPSLNFSVAAWVSCLIISAIFFAMTAVKLLTPFRWDPTRSIRQNLNFIESVSPLLVAFVTGGSIFFVMIFGVVLVATCFTLLIPQYAIITIPWVIAIYSLASTRLVLSLKHKAASERNTGGITDLGSIHFQDMRSNGTYGESSNVQASYV